MTRYILHGGGEGQGGKDHDAFFQEIIKNLPKKARVLCVYFAVPDELTYEKHLVYIDFFARNNTQQKDIELIVANKNDFIEQLQDVDAVYFRGGDTNQLLDQVKKYDNFVEVLQQKKIVAGSSAGVYFLAIASYSSSRDIVYEGLGLLPIRANCHYDESKDLSKLDQYDGELVLLYEGEYKIIEK